MRPSGLFILIAAVLMTTSCNPMQLASMAAASSQRSEYSKSLRPAAEQGNAEAQLRLGYMYLFYQGKDYEEVGVQLLTAAAGQGQTEALFHLGGWYAGRNKVKAYMWHNLADLMKSRCFINDLGWHVPPVSAWGEAKRAHLETEPCGAEERDELAKNMTSEEIAEAKKMAQQWLVEAKEL